MQILGYLLVLALFGGNNNKYNNFSIEVQKVRELVKDIFKDYKSTNEPVFTMEDLRRGNLINKGTVAKYYSKAIRDYIIYRNVSSEEEGFVLTFNNFKATPSAHADNKNAENKEKSPTVIFIPKEGVNVNDVNNKDLRSAIAKYIDTVQKKIDSNEIGVVPTKSDLLEVDVENNRFTVNPTKQNGAEIPKELSKSRVYNSNELKEDKSKINKDLSIEKNNDVLKDQNKMNEQGDNLTILQEESLNNSLVDNNKTGENEIKNTEELNKLLHERKSGIILEFGKNIINESKIELNTDNANISSSLFYENTPKLNQINDMVAKEQDSKTIPGKDKQNKTSNFLSIGFDKTVENKPKELKVIEDKFIDKINTAEDNNAIPDLLNKDDRLAFGVKQETKENLTKTREHIANYSHDTTEEKDKIHKIPKLIEKSDKENKSVVEKKIENGFELDTSKRKDESKPTISKAMIESVSTTNFNVHDLENKTNSVLEKYKVPENISDIQSNNCDVLTPYKKVSKNSPHKLIQLDKPEVNREDGPQVSEFVEKYLTKGGIENKINTETKNNKENSGEDDDSDKFNKNLTEGPVSKKEKNKKPESGNKSKSESENNQNASDENNTFDLKDLKDFIELKPVETETEDSQVQTSSESTSEWNKERNFNGEGYHNSEEDTERKPLLEILNLGEIERAQESGFAIELPNDYETASRSSSEEDDWDVEDEYDD